MSAMSSWSGSGSKGFTKRPDTVCRYGPGAGGAWSMRIWCRFPVGSFVIGGTSDEGSAMLGRRTYTPEELDAATATLERQLAAYEQLPEGPARDAFEPLFFNNLALALDRFFVHR